MAIVVQDDSGSQAAATSYVTVDEFKAYHAARGNDISDYATGDIEKALVRALDHLDTSFEWVGDKRAAIRTEWPRWDAQDRSRNQLNGVPTQIKEAQHEYGFVALSQDLNPVPERDDSGRVVESKSEKVGPLAESVSYADGGSFQMPEHPKADQKILAAGLALDGSDMGRG